MSELDQKLINVQMKLKAPKGQYNSFANFKYRSAEDILEAVKPLNDEEGLRLTLSDKPIIVGDWHYVEATATIKFKEETLSVTASARESENKKGMDHSQITGTASSYARKYALNGLYLIDDTKDADTDEYTNNQNNRPNIQSDSITPQQIGSLKTKAAQMAKLHNITTDEVFQRINVSNIELLTTQQAAQHISNLDRWMGEKQ